MNHDQSLWASVWYAEIQGMGRHTAAPICESLCQLWSPRRGQATHVLEVWAHRMPIEHFWRPYYVPGFGRPAVNKIYPNTWHRAYWEESCVANSKPYLVVGWGDSLANKVVIECPACLSFCLSSSFQLASREGGLRVRPWYQTMVLKLAISKEAETQWKVPMDCVVTRSAS